MLKKLTTCDVPYLSIQQLKGAKPGDKYSVGDGLVKVHVCNDYFLFLYPGCDFKQRITIDYTNVNYGKRSWFRCPNCYERTGGLYLRGLFKCRKCHDLTYVSCQISGNRLDELARKIRIRQLKLGM